MDYDYLKGVIEQVPQQSMKRKRGGTYEYLQY